jgi:hypothetical protein
MRSAMLSRRVGLAALLVVLAGPVPAEACTIALPFDLVEGAGVIVDGQVIGVREERKPFWRWLQMWDS